MLRRQLCTVNWLPALPARMVSSSVTTPVDGSANFQTPTETSNLKDFEVKDPQVIFDSVWEQIEAEKEIHQLCFPKEVIFLGGAPGAGKGTNTPFITQGRGFTSAPIVMSQKLDTTEFREIKSRGEMIADADVFRVMLESLLDKQYEVGALVDGFPRTHTQVALTKLFHRKCIELRKLMQDTPYAEKFSRPSFKMCVLFVTEQESLRRQLQRGNDVKAHNEKVKESGAGDLLPVRSTDMDPELVKQRYSVFKEHYSSLTELQGLFPFHVINAMGPVEDVQRRILDQLAYQSSLELSSATWDLIHDIPLTDEVTRHARQLLVKRLDGYARKHMGLFKQVVTLLDFEFVPVIQRHSFSGTAVVDTDVPLFEDEIAIDMVIDVLSERGFTVCHTKQKTMVPTFVDKIGKISCTKKVSHVFTMTFPRPVLRRSPDPIASDNISY